MKKNLGKNSGWKPCSRKRGESKSVDFIKKNWNFWGFSSFWKIEKSKNPKSKSVKKSSRHFLGKGKSVRMYSVRARQKVKNWNAAKWKSNPYSILLLYTVFPIYLLIAHCSILNHRDLQWSLLMVGDKPNLTQQRTQCDSGQCSQYWLPGFFISHSWCIGPVDFFIWSVWPHRLCLSTIFSDTVTSFEWEVVRLQ